MNKFYSKKGFYLTLLAFLFWGLISSYWYVCGINNFCEAEVKPEVVKTVIVKEKEIVEVVPVVTKKVIKKKFTCSPYLSGIISLGKRNSTNEVAKLEKFLNEFEGENVAVNGVYSSTDRKAVIRMQDKYSKDGKALGYKTKSSDGVVGPKTRLKINELYCLAKSKEQLNAKN